MDTKHDSISHMLYLFPTSRDDEGDKIVHVHLE